VLLQSTLGSGWLDDVADLQRAGAEALRSRLASAPPATGAQAQAHGDAPALEPGAGWPEPAPANAASPEAAQPAPEQESRPSLAVPAMLRARPAVNPAEQPPPASDDKPDARPVVLSFAKAMITTHEGQSAAVIDILRSGDRDRPAEFVWWTTDGTAHARDDYASFGKRVERLKPGETARRLYIPIASDAVPEPEKYFEVHLEAKPASARIGQIGTIRVNIVDDDL
jgi:hypothetical protein